MCRNAAIWLIAGAWLATVLTGFSAWHRYETTPGKTGVNAVALQQPNLGRWQLVVFVHPRCPCSRATLSEMAEIGRTAPDLDLRVVFVRPLGAPNGWEQTENWETAARIPRVRVECDTDGAESHRYGAETSGCAILIDPMGQVVFRGGLTSARGREGISLGRKSVLGKVNGGEGPCVLPVFGCPLHTPQD